MVLWLCMMALQFYRKSTFEKNCYRNIPSLWYQTIYQSILSKIVFVSRIFRHRSQTRPQPFAARNRPQPKVIITIVTYAVAACCGVNVYQFNVRLTVSFNMYFDFILFLIQVYFTYCLIRYSSRSIWFTCLYLCYVMTTKYN